MKEELKEETEKQPNEKETGLMDEVLVGDNDLRVVKHKASTPQTTFNMIKLFLGISILASPHAFSNSGVLGGIIGISFATVLAIITVIMQSEAAMKVDKEIKSYSELGYAVYRGRGKLIVDCFILIAQMGIWIAYLIFNGTQIDQIIWLESQGEVWNHKNLYILFAVIILSPVWWIKHLK